MAPPRSPPRLPDGIDVGAIGCLIGSMTTDQLAALGAMAQDASVEGEEPPSKGKLMGGLLGIMAGRNATTRLEEGRGAAKQFTDEAAKETAPLVKRTKSLASAALKSARVDTLIVKLKEGNIPLRLAATCGGMAMVISGALAVLGDVFTLSIIKAVYQGYIALFGLCIVTLESRNNMSKTLTKVGITEYAKFLTLVWGRGLFYFYCGTICLAEWNLMDIIVGVYMMVLGVCMVYYGREAQKKLTQMHSQFSSETDLKRAFDKHDADSSGSLDAAELSKLCKEMGAVLSRSELEAALVMLDTTDDGLIQYEEFSGWWHAYNQGVMREGAARSPRAR